MKIDVKKVAELSNLSLSSEEETEFDTQLNNILTYIEQLNSLDTSNIKPTAQVTGLKNITRPDEVDDFMLKHDEAISGSDKKYNGMFVVDKLVDTNE